MLPNMIKYKVSYITYKVFLMKKKTSVFQEPQCYYKLSTNSRATAKLNVHLQSNEASL